MKELCSRNKCSSSSSSSSNETCRLAHGRSWTRADSSDTLSKFKAESIELENIVGVSGVSKIAWPQLWHVTYILYMYVNLNVRPYQKYRKKNIPLN